MNGRTATRLVVPLDSQEEESMILGLRPSEHDWKRPARSQADITET